jgi:hypothetical protein
MGRSRTPRYSERCRAGLRRGRRQPRGDQMRVRTDAVGATPAASSCPGTSREGLST